MITIEKEYREIEFNRMANHSIKLEYHKVSDTVALCVDNKLVYTFGLDGIDCLKTAIEELNKFV